MPEQEPILGRAYRRGAGRAGRRHAVREMFSAIAPRYDLLNHVLSLNTDRYWWWRAARSFRHILRRPGDGRAGSVLRHRRHESGAL